MAVAARGAQRVQERGRRAPRTTAWRATAARFELVGGTGVDTLAGGEDDDTLISKGDGAADVVGGGEDSAVTGEADQDTAVADVAATTTTAATDATATDVVDTVTNATIATAPTGGDASDGTGDATGTSDDAGHGHRGPPPTDGTGTGDDTTTVASGLLS